MEPRPFALWAGAECTLARVGNVWRNQVEETGHADRLDDLTLLRDLGARAVRYPILWEQIAPDSIDQCEFQWTDQRLNALREQGTEVIGGLLHHGSGPHYTHLLDPEFPAKFGQFVHKVAERYSWIDKWTPINEPLTTARFSALYGHWYPHRRDFAAFARALVNQCLGTVTAMRIIRSVNPQAQLVQTEDLGRTFATASLRGQAVYDNHRRWLTFDLLCGRVRPGHFFYRKLLAAGITEAELGDLATGDGRPDLLGINHYLTSERYLDHRTRLYDPSHIGSNGRQRYADVEAARIHRLARRVGIRRRLREAWQRYGIPVAVTEVQHGCTRDEQTRWFCEVWDQCRQAQKDGVDVRAVTLWAAFGAYDWRSLLTRRHGHYDVGAFDMRGTDVRPTLVAQAARSLAATGSFDHPVLDSQGWWKRSSRLYDSHPFDITDKPRPGRPIWITGATGTLGQALARFCDHRGLTYVLTTRGQCDITDAASVTRAVAAIKPWAVINASGFVRVADAEREVDACLAANFTGALNLASACEEQGIPCVTFSSDLVFDGTAGPYDEICQPCPGSVYGQSKALAEQSLMALMGRHLIIRTSAFFGGWDRYNFAYQVAASLISGQLVRACPHTVVSPTFVPDLCHAALDLLLDGCTGITHVGNQGAVSWHQFAQMVAEALGYDKSLIRAAEGGRPANTALVSNRFAPLRPLSAALADWAHDVRVANILPVPIVSAA
ncbi:MAG: family 1 glycosylhydrolase [Novosphingobium sp.]